MKVIGKFFNKIKKRQIAGAVIQLAVIGATFIVLSSSLNNDFVPWDDPGHLLENPLVRKLNAENVGKILTTTVNGTYIPLTILSFNLEYLAAKYTAFIYHFNNLLLHLAVTVLVFAFARELGQGLLAAFFGSLLFGIHPMHVEAVAWVTARKDVLYSVFYLLAMLAYLRYLERGARREYVLTILFGILSVLAKPMALSLPLILFLCDWFKGRKLNVKVIAEKFPIFLAVSTIAWITYALNARVPGQNVFEAGLIWVWTLIFYVKKFFLPMTLAPLYHAPEPISLVNAAYIFSTGIFLSMIFLLIKFRRRKWVMLAFLYYFLSIFFLLRYDTLVDKSVVADRFMYLPSLGFCLMIGAVLERAWEKAKHKPIIIRQSVYILITGMFLLLGLKAQAQCKVWKDGISLWSEVIKHLPNEISAYNNRGVTYHNRGQFDLALKDFNKAARLNPSVGKTYLNRGVTYASMKKLELAIDDYNRALEYMPENAEIYNNRGAAFLKQGLDSSAFSDFNKAIEMDPELAEAYNNRGKIYSARRQYDRSLADYTKAISIDSHLATAYNNRGADYYETEQYEAAIDDFTEAINIDPRYKTALRNRASAYVRLGGPKKSFADGEKGEGPKQ